MAEVVQSDYNLLPVDGPEDIHSASTLRIHAALSRSAASANNKSALSKPNNKPSPVGPADTFAESILDLSELGDTLTFLPSPSLPISCPPTSSAVPRRGILRREFTVSSSLSATSDYDPTDHDELLPSPTSGLGSPYTSFAHLVERRQPKRVSISLPPSKIGPGETNIENSARGNHAQAAKSLNLNLMETTESAVAMTEKLLGEERANGRQKRKKLQRLQSTLEFSDLARNELELKANLYFHVCNPVKRWKVERVVPIKLLLQLLKTFCLVTQVILFTFTIPHLRTQFFYQTRTVFESLFIRDFQFDPDKPRVPYTLFSIDSMMDQINYTASQYYDLPKITLGGYDFKKTENGSIVPITMNFWQYREANLMASSNSYVLDGRLREIPFSLIPPSVEPNITKQVVSNTNDPEFSRFVKLDISIPVKNIRVVHPARAECYLFAITITFKNKHNNGMIVYELFESHEREDCHGNILTPTNTLPVVSGFLTALDVIVLSLCGGSLFLTFTTLRRALKLGKAMGSFYKQQLDLPLTWWERRSLFSPWHTIIFFSDCLIVSGTVQKILLDYFVFDITAGTSILLGTALLLQAGVILRYISYFKQLNALTRTLKLAFPELLKFLLCAFVLFIAFSFCGWFVLGPYHPKFVTFFGSIEALFGLLNGDDIYTTYIQISPYDDVVAYIYSRVFLYVFLFLFIYAVLNLFTSLVISAYEESQKKDPAMKNEVTKFIFSGPLTPNGIALRDVTRTKKYVDPQVILDRRKQKTMVEESFDNL